MYFEKKKTSVIKYDVEIDTTALEVLRGKIIVNCSTKTQRKVECTNGIVLRSITQGKRNHCVTYQKVGVQEYFDGPDEDLYDIQYIEYTYPPIITYIDEVLAGNQTNLDRLLHPVIPKKEKKKDDSQVLKKLHAISLANIRSIEDIEKTIQELQSIRDTLIAAQERQELNKDIISEATYYDAVKACIHLTKIDEIDLETYTRMEQFQCSDQVSIPSDKTIKQHR